MEKDKENLERLEEIYNYYKDADTSSVPILLYRVIRALRFRINEEEINDENKD